MKKRKKLFTIFEEGSENKEINFAVNICKDLIDSMPIFHINTVTEMRPHKILQRALKILNENSVENYRDGFVLFCGDNLYLLNHNIPCDKLDAGLLIEKLLLISGGYETDKQKEVFQSLLTKGFEETSKIHPNLNKSYVYDMYEEVVGRDGTPQQKEMIRGLFLGGVPKLLEIEDDVNT